MNFVRGVIFYGVVTPSDRSLTSNFPDKVH